MEMNPCVTASASRELNPKIAYTPSYKTSLPPFSSSSLSFPRWPVNETLPLFSRWQGNQTISFFPRQPHQDPLLPTQASVYNPSLITLQLARPPPPPKKKEKLPQGPPTKKYLMIFRMMDPPKACPSKIISI